MKRLIYAMSFPRRKVLQKMESISAVLNTHIIHYFTMKSYSHRRKLNKIRKELEEDQKNVKKDN